MPIRKMPPMKPQEKAPLRPAEEPPKEPVATLQGFGRGDLVFVKIPYPFESPDYANMTRNLHRVAEEAGVQVLFFSSEQNWEALIVDDRQLAEANLTWIQR